MKSSGEKKFSKFWIFVGINKFFSVYNEFIDYSRIHRLIPNSSTYPEFIDLPRIHRLIPNSSTYKTNSSTYPEFIDLPRIHRLIPISSTYKTNSSTSVEILWSEAKIIFPKLYLIFDVLLCVRRPTSGANPVNLFCNFFCCCQMVKMRT